MIILDDPPPDLRRYLSVKDTENGSLTRGDCVLVVHKTNFILTFPEKGCEISQFNESISPSIKKSGMSSGEAKFASDLGEIANGFCIKKIC